MGSEEARPADLAQGDAGHRARWEYAGGAAVALGMLVVFLWPRSASDADLEARLPAQIFLGRASYLLKLGKEDLAARELEKAVAADPADAEARLVLGNHHFDGGRFEEAAAEYRAALALRETPLAHYDLGLALQRLGRLDEAVASLRRAAELDPDFPLAHLQLGIALSRAGRVPEAVEPFRRAAELDPASLDARHDLGYAYRVTGETQKGIELLEGVLREDPSRVITLFELGMAYRDAGRKDRAEELFRKVLQIDPDHGSAAQELEALTAGRGERVGDPPRP